MQANLSHVVDELRRATDLQIRKSCVAIKLNGTASQLDQDGNYQQPGMTLIWHINNVDGKNILINAHQRDPNRYIRFIAEMASELVDAWDEKFQDTRRDELDEGERERSDALQLEWLTNYEIPRKILMEYLGDALGFEGEWIEGRG